MIYTISGVLSVKRDKLAVVEAGGIGFRVLVSEKTAESLPPAGAAVKFFSYLHVRENGFELYGFLTEAERELFELLNSVSGVGPKSALAVLSLETAENVKAAILENRAELLSRASGIGRKTAERIILELKNKIELGESGELVKRMESDADIVEALAEMGYSKSAAREALKSLPKDLDEVGTRLKEALKFLGRKSK